MITSLPLSAGPTKKEARELGVHIIKLIEDPPPAHGQGAGPSAASLAEAGRYVGKPAKTDIIVFEHKPWHAVNGQLKEHPQVHVDYPETILEVSFSAREMPVWWSEQPFRITSVHAGHAHPPGPAAGVPPPAPPAGVPPPAAPTNPFDGPPPPYDASPEMDAAGQKTIWCVRARPIVQASVGHTYKINFNIGEDIDPDMSCGP